ncbi:MAG TPA: sigma-70 family RNA polymerase sigma factor [Actinospica sp.]|nr:sigma-70 family RNA polymerase sigma factor [Actinospica sp.]
MLEETTTEAEPTGVGGGASEHAVAVRTAAYAELYRERNKQLVAYACALTGNPQVAADLVAEAHFRVWRRLRAGHEVRNVPAYLTTTVRNLAAGLGRGRRETVRDSGAPRADTAALAPALRASHVELLARLLKELPDRWASALWYAEVEDLPMEGVGVRIGAGASTAAVVLTRARERLRQAFLQSQPGTPADQACAEYWRLMPSLVRGSASARQSRRVADHTEGCADCRERVAALTETNDRMPLILGPALLAGVLGGGGAWLMPSLSGATRTGSKMARHARVRTGVLSHARASVFARSITPAKGALVGSVGVVGIAAAATALALGTATPHHDTAAATTATTTTSPSSAATGGAAATTGSAPSTVTAAAAAAAPASPTSADGSASPDATRNPLAQTSPQSALVASRRNSQVAQQFSASLPSTTTTAPSAAQTTASAAASGTTAAETTAATAPATTAAPTQSSSSPSASATSSASASPSASASTSSAGPTATASDTPSAAPSDTPSDSASGASSSDTATAGATPTATSTAAASAASTSSSADGAASGSASPASTTDTTAP